MKILLTIPEKDLDYAKSLGVSYDVLKKSWTILDNHPNIDIIKEWQTPIVETKLSNFVNEDRTFGEGLFVDLIPASCWFSNVRSCITQDDWQKVRKVVVNRAGNHCEICGIPPDNKNKLYMEVHERWQYIIKNGEHIQRLKRLICLCSNCHMVTHIGFANVRGLADVAVAHLMKVKKLSYTKAMEEVNAAYILWSQRNDIKWKLDISMIEKAGIKILPSPKKS